MCNYCGCRAIPAIAELTDQHEEIAEVAGDLERAIVAERWPEATEHLTHLRRLLTPHVALEEAALFSVMGALDEFAEGVGVLYDDHDDIDSALEQPISDWSRVRVAVHQLFEHIDREEHGLFPASLATFTSDQWDRVHELQARIHADPLEHTA
ncbi:MAG TPA: hemerythrin domain-containing protein [Nocardioidaceae bacterium]|nr:hemerythrin domain-containing protein [Nocardioidaceae bacterium]